MENTCIICGAEFTSNKKQDICGECSQIFSLDGLTNRIVILKMADRKAGGK